jgi:hypothetical protein
MEIENPNLRIVNRKFHHIQEHFSRDPLAFEDEPFQHISFENVSKLCYTLRLFQAYAYGLYIILIRIHMIYSAYLYTYIPTYLPTYLPTCLPACLPSYIHTYIHKCIHTYSTYIHKVTYIHTYVHTFNCLNKGFISNVLRWVPCDSWVHSWPTVSSASCSSTCRPPWPPSRRSTWKTLMGRCEGQLTYSELGFMQ